MSGECPKCKHAWAEHRTTVSEPDEHECTAQVGGAPDGWGSQDCGCMEIPPGHAPDWTVCDPCAAAR